MYSDDDEEPLYRSLAVPAGFIAAPPLINHFPPAPFPSRQSSMELLAAVPGLQKQALFAAAPAACGVPGACAEPGDAPTPAWLSKQNTFETDFHDLSASSHPPVLFHPGSAPLTPPRSRTRSPPNEAAVAVRRRPSLPAAVASSVVVTADATATDATADATATDATAAVPPPPPVARSGSWPPTSPRRAFIGGDVGHPAWEALAASQLLHAAPALPTAAGKGPLSLAHPPPAPPHPPVSPPPPPAEEGDDLDCLSRTLAQLRVETRALRARYQASTAGLQQVSQSNAHILSELQHDGSPSHPPPPETTASASAAVGTAAEGWLSELSETQSEYAALKETSLTEGATIVVDPGFSDGDGEEGEEGEEEEDDDDDEEEEGGAYEAYVEDGTTYLYRGLGSGVQHSGKAALPAGGRNSRDSTARSRAANAAATALAGALSPQQSMELSNGKRARSFAHELASEPLHASKQASDALSRGDPSAERLRVEQLRGLIAAEQREREALLQAFQANESMLTELQAANQKLVEQLGHLKELRRRRQAASAPQ